MAVTRQETILNSKKARSAVYKIIGDNDQIMGDLFFVLSSTRKKLSNCRKSARALPHYVRVTTTTIVMSVIVGI